MVYELTENVGLLCSSLLRECPEQHLNIQPNNEEERMKDRKILVVFTLLILLNSLIPCVF